MRLKSDTLDWALQHSEKVGYLNNFPLPFEFKAIREDWAEIKQILLKIKFPNDWKIGQCRFIFAPKHQFGFRLVTQLDPLDELIYSSIIYEMGNDLENFRIEKNKNIIFSNRFLPSPDGQFWDPDYTFSNFEAKTMELIDSGKYKYVVIADIADFFPRIYTHILDNALSSASSKKEHIKSIQRLLATIYQTVSYGIPVGSDGSFLLGEVLLTLIDRRLIDEDTEYIRYVDDFRIFCEKKTEAYEKLNLLVEIIFKNLSLTLQQHKTSIYDIKTYREIKIGRSTVITPLSEKFHKFIKNKLKITNPYAAIDVENLSPENKKKLDDFNFEQIIQEQIQKNAIDIPLVKFGIRRLIQTNNANVVDDLLKNIDKFYPVMNEVILYLTNLRGISLMEKPKIGEQIISIIENSYIGHSEFNRMWLLSCFIHNNEWDAENKFLNLYRKYSDTFSKRNLILAMGRANKNYWFSSERRDFPQNFTEWEKRAFLAAYSCVPEDERIHWYSAAKQNFNLDILDKAIIKWVQNNPF